MHIKPWVNSTPVTNFYKSPLCAWSLSTTPFFLVWCIGTSDHSFNTMLTTKWRIHLNWTLHLHYNNQAQIQSQTFICPNANPFSCQLPLLYLSFLHFTSHYNLSSSLSYFPHPNHRNSIKRFPPTLSFCFTSLSPFPHLKHRTLCKDSLAPFFIVRPEKDKEESHTLRQRRNSYVSLGWWANQFSFPINAMPLHIMCTQPGNRAFVI